MKNLIKRLFVPKYWSVNARFYLTTGLMLIIGAAFTYSIVTRKMQHEVRESIAHKLSDFHQLVEKQQELSLEFLMTSAAMMGAADKIIQSIQVSNHDLLNFNINRFSDSIRWATGGDSYLLHIFDSDPSLLYSSIGMKSENNYMSDSSILVAESKKYLKPVSGIQYGQTGPEISAVFPVIQNGGSLGFIQVSITYETFFRELEIPTDYGLAILLHSSDEQNAKPDTSEKNKKGHAAEQTVAMQFGVTNLEGLFIHHTSSDSNITYIDNIVATTLPVLDFQGTRIGDMVIFYDSELEIDKLNRTRSLMGWLTGVGVSLILLSLHFNLRHILKFSHGLKLAIMRSQSGNYRSPYISADARCKTVLGCTSKECQNSHRTHQICYFVIGDRAIPLKERNTCIHLKEYKRCKVCPVYAERYGDELAELRHGFDTVMHLWQHFLNTAGRQLDGAFGRDTGYSPSLDDLTEYLDQMAGLTTFSHDIQGVYSKEEVYSQLEWIFKSRFGLDIFTLLEVNASENRMEPVVNLDEIGESHLEVFFDCELCRARRMAEEVISEANPCLCPYFGVDHLQEVRCCIPMVMGGRVGAVFTFKIPRSDWEGKKAGLPVIKQYLEETAPILSSLRLLQISKEQALKDPLTLCHNRRFMDEYLVQIERLNARTPRKIGFIMADLDHFKMVNDEYGHLAGDDILRQLAEIFRSNIRKSDLLIRYGGEEFLIILMEINEEDITFSIAEKLRVAVENAQLSLPTGNTLKKTVSMGVSEFPADADQLYKTIKYADVALYQAKEQGRNRVLRFTPDLWDDEKY